MCGIVALFHRDGAPVSAPGIIAMRDILAHRGPDDSGLFLDGSIGLGHRRLQIIDLAGGHQPMPNAAGTVHLVFNGEIYNYRELRQLLTSHGVRLRTQSDTETILGLYDLFGEDCVRHLRGMFAFVLWDSTRRRLVAARDRLGIKPLYVLRHGPTIAFASEIKALLLVQGAQATADHTSIPEYLVYRNLAGTRTMYRGVERIAPAEVLVVNAEGERRYRYWEAPLPSAGETNPRRLDDWTEELDSLLADVVREHMISDVPLGTFNSGGLDSSLITAYTAQHAAERLNTYSVGFDDPAFDERPHAQIVADRFHTSHHSMVVSERDYADWLPRAIWHHDEPLNHPHSVHLAYLSRLARERVTVVLTGEGSDELFAGYPRYRLARLLDRLSILQPWLAPSLRLAAGAISDPERLRVRAVLNGGGAACVDGLAAFVAAGEVRRVLAGELAHSSMGRGVTGAMPPEILSHALLFDQQTYLQSLLNRLDKMNMAASLEGRVPFLDHRVVELAARVPPSLKIRGMETKFLLKHMARRHLPEQIIGRRKAGFSVPIAAWLRPHGVLAQYVDLLLEPRTIGRGYLDPSRVRSLIAEHRAGARDHSELLWGLVNLEMWQRLMIDAAERPASGRLEAIAVEGARA